MIEVLGMPRTFDVRPSPLVQPVPDIMSVNQIGKIPSPLLFFSISSITMLIGEINNILHYMQRERDGDNLFPNQTPLLKCF